jgi:hypothetical protein
MNEDLKASLESIDEWLRSEIEVARSARLELQEQRRIAFAQRELIEDERLAGAARELWARIRALQDCRQRVATAGSERALGAVEERLRQRPTRATVKLRRMALGDDQEP